jgi:hypothetical protein
MASLFLRKLPKTITTDLLLRWAKEIAQVFAGAFSSLLKIALGER